MGNDHLRTCLSTRGMTTNDLAGAIGVDPRTVERWVELGRVPHPRHRIETARALSVDEQDLWPNGDAARRTPAARRAEILQVFPQRSDVPAELWRRLTGEVEHQIDVLVYAGLFMLDTNPGLPQQLAARASEGLVGRFLFGDPESATVAWRGGEEGIGEDLAARVRLSLNYMNEASRVPQLEIRLHETILYNSIYRFDDEMLVNTHVVGSPAGQNPVLHLRKTAGGHLFDHYLASFERVWEGAQPWQDQ